MDELSRTRSETAIHELYHSLAFGTKLVEQADPRQKRHFGSAAGSVWLSADFDEELPDFDEYR